MKRSWIQAGSGYLGTRPPYLEMASGRADATSGPRSTRINLSQILSFAAPPDAARGAERGAHQPPRPTLRGPTASRSTAGGYPSPRNMFISAHRGPSRRCARVHGRRRRGRAPAVPARSRTGREPRPARPGRPDAVAAPSATPSRSARREGGVPRRGGPTGRSRRRVPRRSAPPPAAGRGERPAAVVPRVPGAARGRHVQHARALHGGGGDGGGGGGGGGPSAVRRPAAHAALGRGRSASGARTALPPPPAAAGIWMRLPAHTRATRRPRG